MYSLRKLMVFTGIVGATLATHANKSSLLPKGEDQVELNWTAEEGNTYFIQWSRDLKEWHFFPVIKVGDDQDEKYAVTMDEENIFLRLNFTDEESDDPFNDDFDGDGISNWDEIRNGGLLTNPLLFSTYSDGVSDGLRDSDLDGLSNGTELSLGTNFNKFDTDDDGLSDGNEVSQSRNPHWKDHPDVMLSVSKSDVSTSVIQ